MLNHKLYFKLIVLNNTVFIFCAEGSDNTTESTLVHLYQSILHNCQGRPKCHGFLPYYNQVKVSSPPETYKSRCDWSNDEAKYLARVDIVTRCQGEFVGCQSIESHHLKKKQSNSIRPETRIFRINKFYRFSGYRFTGFTGIRFSFYQIVIYQDCCEALYLGSTSYRHKGEMLVF